MDFKEIKELIEIFDSSSLSSISITNEDSKIKLEKGGRINTQNVPSASLPQVQIQNMQGEMQASIPVSESVSPKKDVSGDSINSPMVGTFYRCPSPSAPAYVNVGDKVKKGQTLAIIEAMKIMNEIEAEFDCVIKEILPSDAQPVEYNTPLFIVERI